MTTTLVIPGGIADRIAEIVRLTDESAGVLLTKAVPTERGLRLLARELLEVPDDAYDQRDSQQLVIRSRGYVPALARAEIEGCIPIWFHTHPGAESSPTASRLDRKVNSQLNELFRIRADSQYYGWLIVSLDGNRLSFTGGLDDGEISSEIDRLWVVGSKLDLIPNSEKESKSVSPIFDRNIRAFGGAIQRELGDLTIAVVGCGGTGSAVAEQLLRLGVRNFILVDPEDLTESNVTRVYGSRTVDVGRAKVDIAAEHLESIVPDTFIERIKSMVTVESTAESLVKADVVFGCTDDNAGRIVLSRLATYFIIPIIDSGVLLTSDNSEDLDGVHGRVTVMHPGQACLICRGRIDLDRARSELMSPDERTRLVGEGYAPALVGAEPAVVAFTTMVAAMAVGELLERLVHYGVDPAPSEVLIRLHDREVSTNSQLPRERHFCDPATGKLGVGITIPFLEQTWSV